MIELNRLRALDLDDATHVAAASGLVRVGSRFFVVADDELHIAAFELGTVAPGRKLRVLPGTLPPDKKARKRAKPDFEALAVLPDGRLLLVPSGSKPQRHVGVVVTLDPNGALASPPQTVDFSSLFNLLGGTIKRLNIEGAVLQGECLRLLQRGNSVGAVNAVIDVEWEPLWQALLGGRPVSAPLVRRVSPFDLGRLAGVPLTFTDGAALGSDQLYFTAAAEATDDAYDDAPCTGSAFGLIEGAPGEALRLVGTSAFGRAVKVEGLAVEPRRSASGDVLDLYLVTDHDDASAAAELFTATVPAAHFATAAKG